MNAVLANADIFNDDCVLPAAIEKFYDTVTRVRKKDKIA